MAKIKPDDKIEAIFDQKGSEWTKEERREVIQWLFDNSPHQYLLGWTKHHLGGKATKEDAEDAWQDFCVRRLGRIISSYDPAKGRRFWNYLLFCLKRFCYKKAGKLQERAKQETPLTKGRDGEEDNSIDLEFLDGKQDSTDDPTGDDTVRNEFRRHLEKCLNGLRNPRHREVFEMCALNQLLYREAAKKLGVSAKNIGAWLRRARLLLRQCLQEKGWNPS